MTTWFATVGLRGRATAPAGVAPNAIGNSPKNAAIEKAPEARAARTTVAFMKKG